MLNSTQVTIVGNAGETPDLRYTANGTPVASFSVAVAQRKRAASGEWADSGTTWYRCVAWRQLAENIAATVTKGTRVIAVGSLASREWESGGKSGVSWEVTVDALGTELSFSTAKVSRHPSAMGDTPLPDDPWAADS